MFTQLLFKNLSESMFSLDSCPSGNWKTEYIQSFNIHHARYNWTTLRQESEYPIDDFDIMFSWPVDPNLAYTTVYYEGFLFTADGTNLCKTRLSDMSTCQILSGHPENIGLVLSNGKGLIVTFDESSQVFVWDADTGECLQVFFENRNVEIFSMNVYEEKLVMGGKDGLVCVWNAITGDCLLELDIPSVYKPNLGFVVF